MIGNNLLMAGDEGYNLTRSLRFRASASAYLSRTPTVTGNRQTWTWSGWIKRGVLGTNSSIFNDTGPSGNNDDTLGFNFSTNNELVVGTGFYTILVTSQLFRDPSAWYHFVVVFDTTQATANNRIKLYVNGVQITSFSTNNIATYIPQNFSGGINTTNAHTFANLAPNNGRHLDGYLAETYFIDGQALTPSSFGEFDSTTGVWQPARYTGTYGTNGFYLPFTDNSALTTASNVGLGKDFSGNANYWVTNNISITAGTTYDSMTDVPTLTSATAANFAVLNPLTSDGTISNANLTVAWSGGNSSKPATIGVTSGKWYCELLLDSSPSNAMFAGIIPASMNPSASYPGSASGGYGYFGDGQKYTGGAGSAYGAAINVGDTVGIAFDADNGKLWFSKNGVWQASGDPAAGTNAAFTSIAAGTWFLCAGHSGTCTLSTTFGQRPFSYTPPTGFVALNAYNLPDSTIKQGNKVMDATLYTGTGATRSVTNAASFKPDFVWIKNRSSAADHYLYDSIRGAGYGLYSDLTSAEIYEATQLTSFNSNGFSVSTGGATNGNTNSLVGWQWQAGQGSSSSNTNGTITSTVSVNASAGFSVVTYTGTGANATVGHGLGVAPSFYVVKSRSYSSGNWVAWHTSIGQPNILWMNTTNGNVNYPTAFNSTNPTSSVISLGTAAETNGNGYTFVAYCWSEIAGYSKFGSYTGNGSADGPFVYTGFRAKFVLIKCSSSTDGGNGDWILYDTARNTYNIMNSKLFANLSSAEATFSPGYDIDFLSNGFKVRNPYANYGTNTSGQTYIYAAFAENPFKNSLAR